MIYKEYIMYIKYDLSINQNLRDIELALLQLHINPTS